MAWHWLPIAHTETAQSCTACRQRFESNVQVTEIAERGLMSINVSYDKQPKLSPGGLGNLQQFGCICIFSGRCSKANSLISVLDMQRQSVWFRENHNRGDAEDFGRSDHASSYLASVSDQQLRLDLRVVGRATCSRPQQDQFVTFARRQRRTLLQK